MKWVALYVLCGKGVVTKVDATKLGVASTLHDFGQAPRWFVPTSFGWLDVDKFSCGHKRHNVTCYFLE